MKIITGIFLIYAAAFLSAHTLKSEEPPLDLVPFALPGTPANEVRFVDPREIREVIVTLKSAPPANLACPTSTRPGGASGRNCSIPRSAVSSWAGRR